MRTTGKLAAQRSATIIDDLGRRVEIVAGQTYWDPSASELRRAEVASLFGIGSESRWFAPSGAVDTSRAEPVASNPPLETPELRSSPSPVRVRVGRTARDDMLADLFELTRSDGLEAGGFLFGPPSYSWHKEVRITSATPTADAIRGSDSLKLDTREWLEAERSFERAGFDDVLLGVWHCHPDESARTCEPSTLDLRAWASALDYSRGRSINSYSVGLVYTAAPFWGDSWASPGPHCYVTRTDRCGRLITEPAEVL